MTNATYFIMASWLFAFIAVVAGAVMFCRSGKWLWLLETYISTGLFVIALPFKIACPAMNLFGIVMMTTFWPVWLGQEIFGYDLTKILPEGFWTLVFSF